MKVLSATNQVIDCITSSFRLFRLSCTFRERNYDLRTSFNFARNRQREMRGLK